jgi:hypothetical protein
MSAEIKKEEKQEVKTKKTFQDLMKIAEFRMIIYVVPVALLCFLLALILKK